MTESAPDASTLWDYFSLILTVTVIGLAAYAAKLGLAAVNNAIAVSP